MRILIVCLAVAAVAGGAWMLLQPSSDGGTDDYANEGDGGERGGELRGMRVGDGPDPDATQNPGRGSIEGTVRLAGAPVAASVELRVVATTGGDSMEDLLNTVGKVFVDRLLDGGVGAGGALDTDKASEDGRFKFKNVGPGLYEVRAADAEGRRAVAAVAIPADGARVEVDVDLPSGDVTLRGRVRFDDDTPFRGTVVVSPGVSEMSPFMPARGPQTQTDDEGRFVIGGLAPGTVVVNAIAPGSLRAMALPITLPFDGEYVLTIGAGGSPVSGKVIAADTKEPIVGARVLAGGGNPGAGFTLRTTETDAEGKFELSVPGVEGGMIAMADGYGMGMVELRHDRPTGLVIPLPKLAKISGTITAKEGGEPLAGVAIFAMPGGGGMGPFAMPASARSDADGRFVLEGVHPGVSSLFAYGNGWVTEGVPRRGDLGRRGVPGLAVTLKPGEEKAQDLVAIKAGRVEGTVRGSDGKPVRGAVVSLTRSGDFMLRFAALLGVTAGLESTVTDVDGRFEMDTVMPGTEVRISASAVGYAKTESDSFTTTGGETTQKDLTLETARWLTVTVVAEDSGDPIANAVVIIRKTNGERGFVDMMNATPFITDAMGRARVGPLAKGEFDVRAQAKGYLEPDDGVDVPADADEATIRLTPGLKIGGRITLPDGMAASQVQIRATLAGRGGWQREETAPKADGSFVLTGLKDTLFHVSARGLLNGKRYEAEVKGVQAGTMDVDLTLAEVEGGSLITITVNDANGDPVSAARIEISMRYTGGGTSSSSRRLSAGRAVFEMDRDRDPDEIYVQVYRIESGEGGALFHGPIDPSANEIELQLPPARTVEGRVIAGGKPVAGVQVEAQVVPPTEEGRDGRGGRGDTHATGVSDDKGRFELSGLGPYEYKLNVQPPAQYVRLDGVELGARESKTTIELYEGRRAEITVVDASGKPLAGAMVSATARNEDGGYRQGINGRTDARGVVLLQGLPHSGDYWLNVNPPQGRDDLRNYMSQNWRPEDTRVQLEEAFVISGVVRTKQGEPFARGTVRARPADGKGQSFSGQVDKKGRFTIKGMPAGEYTLKHSTEGEVHHFRDPSTEEKVQRVRAPAKNVTVTVDLGLSVRLKIARWSGEGWHHGNLQASDNSGNGHSSIGEDGTVLFHGLKEGVTYTFSMMQLPGDRYVLRTGLRPGDDVTVQMKKGLTIRGSVRLPDGFKGNVNVNLNGEGFAMGSRLDKNNRFEIRGVPEGTWTVRAHAWSERVHYQGEASVAAGGEVEITLEKRR